MLNKAISATACRAFAPGTMPVPWKENYRRRWRIIETLSTVDAPVIAVVPTPDDQYITLAEKQSMLSVVGTRGQERTAVSNHVDQSAVVYTPEHVRAGVLLYVPYCTFPFLSIYKYM